MQPRTCEHGRSADQDASVLKVLIGCSKNVNVFHHLLASCLFRHLLNMCLGGTRRG